MASSFFRSAARSPIFSVRPRFNPFSRAPPRSTPLPTAPSLTETSRAGHRRLAYSRTPVELGSCAGGSMYPLHSTVAAAKLNSCLSSTSRNCRALTQDEKGGKDLDCNTKGGCRKKMLLLAGGHWGRRMPEEDASVAACWRTLEDAKRRMLTEEEC